MLARRAALPPEEAANLTRFHLWRERALVDSMERFFRIPEATRADSTAFLSNTERLVGEVKPAPTPQGDGRLIFRRNAKLKGPMGAFGYDYFTDHYGAERERCASTDAVSGTAWIGWRVCLRSFEPRERQTHCAGDPRYCFSHVWSNSAGVSGGVPARAGVDQSYRSSKVNSEHCVLCVLK